MSLDAIPTAADTAETEARWVAYRAEVQAQGRNLRYAGFIACLIGVLILIAGRYKFGGAPELLWAGAGTVAVGWALFIYAMSRRLTWIRAHPFDTNPAEPNG